MDRLKNRWHLLPINQQLLLLVNTILVGFVVVLLAVDYRVRMDRRLSEKQTVLTNEAKTMYEALRVVEHHGAVAIQDLVDSVCEGMNSNETTRHRIAATWNGQHYDSISNGSAPLLSNSALYAAPNSDVTESIMADSSVAGSFNGPLGAVRISENRATVLMATHYSLLSQTLGVLASGLLAAFVASTVLRQLVTKPIQGVVSALRSVAAGDLSAIAHMRSCRELSYLTEQVNIMTRTLDYAQRDHRLHMEKARELQQHLRPTLSGLIGIDVAELFEPADDVGGDYYDVISLTDGRLLLCVADVAGHGIPAAMAATLLKAFVSEAAKQTVSPAAILTEVNQRYCEYVKMGHFATMTLVVIDNSIHSLTYANAGHEMPFLQVDSSEPIRLQTGDLPLGVDAATLYMEETVQILGNARVVIVSDGVTESFNPADEQYGTNRIETVMRDHWLLSAAETVRELRSSLESFRGGCKPFDDTTLLVAQFTGFSHSSKTVVALNNDVCHDRLITFQKTNNTL